jgi:hypothetical protein
MASQSARPASPNLRGGSVGGPLVRLQPTGRHGKHIGAYADVIRKMKFSSSHSE